MGGMTSLLLLLLAGVTVSTLDLQKRIIKGKPCDKTERLYHVKLIANDGTNDFLCGGSLIRNGWILTAAHCWEDGGTMTAHLDYQPNKVNNPIPITTKETYEDRGRHHDIMLLKLPRGSPTGLETIKLPDCTKKPMKGEKVQIAGLGGTGYITFVNTMGHTRRLRDKNLQTALQCADIEVDDCMTQARLYPCQFAFCGKTKDASSTPSVDTCGGDSGGGVVYNDMIYGVISASGEYACARPAAFVDVCEYMTWIESKTQK